MTLSAEMGLMQSARGWMELRNTMAAGRIA